MINNSNLVRLTVLTFLLTQLSCLVIVGAGSSILFTVSELAMQQHDFNGNAQLTMVNGTYMLKDPQGNLLYFTPSSAVFNQSINFNVNPNATNPNVRHFNYLIKSNLDQAFLQNHYTLGANGYSISYFAECGINDPRNYGDTQTSGLISWEFFGCGINSQNTIYCSAQGNTHLQICTSLDDFYDLGSNIVTYQNSFWVHFTRGRRILI